MNYVSLGKAVSYALRHNPKEFGVDRDAEGWVSLSSLIDALNKRGRYSGVTPDMLIDMNDTADKKRFEIDVDNDRIRAYYGYSGKDKINLQLATPPSILYHGTTPEAAEEILKSGIKPMGRQYANLSTTIETAKKVGGRRTRNPVILAVKALDALSDGKVKFYNGNEDIWSVDYVPPEYIVKD